MNLLTHNQDIKDNIVQSVLPHVPFDGWTWQGVKQACGNAGYTSDMAIAVFPQRLDDVLSHFADMTDRLMLQELENINTDELAIRKRIKIAVLKRLAVLQENKEAEKFALSYWAIPGRQTQASKILWRTADRIWIWAGDTATDYNYTTKRLLLSGVIASTTLAWTRDQTFNYDESDHTHFFLDRQIERVLKIGQFSGRYIKKLSSFSILQDIEKIKTSLR